MVVRAKTRKRLVIVLVTVVLVVGLVTGYLVAKRNKAEKNLQLSRQEGIEYALNGEHNKAVNRLGTYLTDTRNSDIVDVEVLLLYAKAREHVEDRGDNHIIDAINKLRQAVPHDPGNTQARRDLVRLYTTSGRYNTEAIELARKLLDTDPADSEALWAMAVCSARKREFAEAMSYAERYTRLNALSFRGHRLTLNILHQIDRPREQIVAYVEGLLAKEPGEPRYQVIAAYAYTLLEDKAKTTEHIDRAIETIVPDKDTTGEAFYILQELHRYDDARAYLGRALKQAETEGRPVDRNLKRQYVVSLWEANRYHDMIEQLKDYRYSNKEIDSQLLALRVLALKSMGRDASETEGPITALSKRKGTTAEAWSIIFASGLIDGKLKPARAVEVCQQAVGVNEYNAYLIWMLGNAHYAVGDTDLALNRWLQAASYRRGWPAPAVSISKLLRQRREYVFAAQWAQKACMRAQTSYDAIITYAEASSDLLDRAEPAAIADLRRRIEMARSQAPSEARLIMVYAKVLAHQGDKDQLEVLVGEVLNIKPSPPAELLVRMADISRERELGLDQPLLDRAQAVAPNSPQVALAQAMFAAIQGEVEDGRQILENARTNSNAPDSPAWRIHAIRYEVLQGKRVDAATWAALADDYAEALAVQKLVLDEPGAWQDRALIDRVIDRLKALTGEQSVSWRIYRARWHMHKGDAVSIADAVKLLEHVIKQSPNRFETYLLLARCLQLQDKTSGAIKAYSDALTLRPTHLTTKLALANLHLIQNDPGKAVQLIKEIVSAENVTPTVLRSAARLAMNAERTDLSLQIVQAAKAAEPDNVTNDLLLAGVYRSKDQDAKAEAIYRRLLEKPTPATIELVSDYYASSGRMEEARATLARLEEADAAPDMAAIIRGTFELTYGQTDAALAQFQAAVDAAPAADSHWGLLIGQQVRFGRLDAALASLDRAAEACPTSPLITEAHANRPLLEKLGRYNLFRSLLVSMVSDAKNQAPAIEALKLLEKTTVEQLSQGEVEVAIRSIGARYPSYLPLQMVTVHLVRRQGRVEDAAELARQTARAFPEASEPAALAAEFFATAGRWREVLEVSREWRRRITHDPLPADLMMARASLILDRPEDALRMTRPYIKMALADADTYAQLVLAHCHALIALERQAEAEKMLSPRLAESQPIRSVWMQLALFGFDDADSAGAWLKRIEPIVATKPVEYVSLAQMYRGVDERFGIDVYKDRATQILETLVAGDDPPVEAVKALAMLEDFRRNKPRAIALYRRVLAMDDQDALAMNNLAMLLLEDDRSAEEAYALASRAAELASSSPSLQDTLAQALSKLGRHDEAVLAMRKAVQLEPRSFEMWVRLGHIYLDAGNTQEATDILKRLEEEALTNENLDIKLRQSINGLRTRLISG